MLKETVTGVLESNMKHDDVCKRCILGKYAKATFPRIDSILYGVLQHVNLDICRRMSTRSLKGYEYFVTFIDYYSRKTRIYFLKTKDEVFS